MSNEEQPSVSTDEKRYGRGRRGRHGFLSGIVIGGVVGAILAVSVGTFAQFGGPRSAHFGEHDPEFAAERAELAVEMLLGRVDATQDQQAAVSTIVQGVITDLRAVVTEHESTRETVREILMQPDIDRGALEQLRASAILQADSTSQRMVQALGDVAEVLTPEQRVELMEVGRWRRH